MPDTYAAAALFYILRNAPTFLAVFFIMLLAVRNRLRFSFGKTVAIGIAVIAVASIAAGLAVACLPEQNGVYATAPLAAVFLAVFFACTRLSWGKRLFVLLSGMVIAAFSVLVYDVALTLVYDYSDFWQRRILEAIVCFAVPLAMAPLFNGPIRWAIEQIDEPRLWRMLAAVPIVFFLLACALYTFVYEASFESPLAWPLYALIVTVLIGLLIASYLSLFAALRTTVENARLKAASQLESLQHARYENLKRQLEDTAKARHDARHQMLVIRSFAERGALDDLQKYLNEQGALAFEQGQQTYALNFAIDAVCAHFAERAHACGAETSLRIDLPERLPLPEADVCIALANLMENAVEACERLAAAVGQTNESREIFLHVDAQTHGDAIIVSVENSCTHDDARALLEAGAAAPVGQGTFSHAPRSAKRDGEGIGLASVATIAEGHRGEVRIACTDNPHANASASVRLLLRTPAG